MLYKDFVREKTHHLTRIKSAEGYPCVFDDSKGKALKNYKVYGNSVQDGTPTPTAPVEIESVGNKSKNLLNVADYFSDYLDEDGKVVFNQGDFSNIYNKIILKNSFKENTRYTLSCTVEISNSVNNNGIRFGFYDSSNTQFTSVWTTTTGSKTFNVKLTNYANTTISYIRISYATMGTRCDVQLSNFQIEEGATATNYIPYGKYDVPMTVHGKNLIPYPYTTLDGELVPTTKTESGVTFTINEDRSITVNGTATDTIYYHLVSTYGTHILILPRAKYYFHDNCDDINSTPRRFMVQAKSINDSNTFLNTLGEGTFDTSSIQSCKIWLAITIAKGDVFENITFKPQLEIGSNATSYEPYKGSITEHIYLDTPLRRINVTGGNQQGIYADYIDFKHGVVVRNTRQAALNGTETWTTVNDYTFGVAIYKGEVYNALCTHSQVIAGRYGVTWYIGATTYSNGGSGFMWNHGGKMTIDEWKAQLAQWYDEGNPLTVVCARIAPIEEAIELPTILTQKGSNIITTDTTVTASNIEVKYIAK